MIIGVPFSLNLLNCEALRLLDFRVVPGVPGLESVASTLGLEGEGGADEQVSLHLPDSAERLSFVEMVTDGSSKCRPTWFCTHWWGLPFCDFLNCIEEHARIHELSADTSYYVGAFALPCVEVNGTARWIRV